MAVSLVVFTLPVLALNSPTPSDSPKIDKSLIEAIAKRNLGKVSKDAQILVDQMNRDEAKARAEAKRVAEEKAKAEAARIEAERIAAEKAAQEAARLAAIAEQERIAAEQARAAEVQRKQAPALPTGSGCEWLKGQLIANGIAPGDVPAAIAISDNESDCTPCKINGGAINCNYTGPLACNVFQELPCGKWGGAGDLAAHIRGADNYAKSRYGGWWPAYYEWQAKKWW